MRLFGEDRNLISSCPVGPCRKLKTTVPGYAHFKHSHNCRLTRSQAAIQAGPCHPRPAVLFLPHTTGSLTASLRSMAPASTGPFTALCLWLSSPFSVFVCLSSAPPPTPPLSPNKKILCPTQISPVGLLDDLQTLALGVRHNHPSLGQGWGFLFPAQGCQGKENPKREL